MTASILENIPTDWQPRHGVEARLVQQIKNQDHQVRKAYQKVFSLIVHDVENMF
jgi:hypothetical protein